MLRPATAKSIVTHEARCRGCVYLLFIYLINKASKYVSALELIYTYFAMNQLDISTIVQNIDPFNALPLQYSKSYFAVQKLQ